MENILVDIDNTICKTIGNDYEHSIPDYEAIGYLNKLYDSGYKIVMFTSRGSKSGKDWKEFTEKQLKEWGLKYNELRFDKPSDLLSIVDDKSVNINDFKLNFDRRIDELATLIANTKRNGTKVLVAGNGGLSSTSSHFVGELVGKYGSETYFRAFSLCDCSSVVTAISNDFGYENVFSHQVMVLGCIGDIFIGMTTSKSKNILKALEQSLEKGMISVILCSENYKDFDANYIYPIHGKDIAEIQENILKFLHKVALKAKEKVNE